MKKDYIEPKAELIEFEVEDIITESSLGYPIEGDNEIQPPFVWWN